MEEKIHVAHVKMDAKTFTRFAVFDTFVLRKRYAAPCIFCAAFIALSLLSFFSGKAQASLLGTVLLVLGLGFPLVYVSTFYSQVRAQCKRLGLKTPKPVYTLALGEKDIRVTNDMKPEPEVKLPWKTLPAVYRRANAFYFYAAPTRAFILPDGQYGCSPAELWDFMAARMNEKHLHGKRPA